MSNSYERPVIVDYGSLADITAAMVSHGSEDGANKHHSPGHSTP